PEKSSSDPAGAFSEGEENAPLGAVAEQPPALTGVATGDTDLSGGEAQSESEKKRPESEASDDAPSSSNARITDRSGRYEFAHRSSNRRVRRGRGGPPPIKAEEHRINGHLPKPNPTISELLREGQEILVQVSKEPLGKKGARITS